MGDGKAGSFGPGCERHETGVAAASAFHRRTQSDAALRVNQGLTAGLLACRPWREAVAAMPRRSRVKPQSVSTRCRRIPAAECQDQDLARQLFPDPTNAARPVQRRNLGTFWGIDQRLSWRAKQTPFG